MSPRGSNASFTEAMSADFLADHCWRPRFTMPTPCSPVTEPPSATASAKSSSRGRLGALELVGRPGRAGTSRAGCRRLRDPSCRPTARGGADLERRFDRLGEPVERDDDVLAHLASALRADRERHAVPPAPERAICRCVAALRREAPSPSARAARRARAASAADPSASAITRNPAPAERAREGARRRGRARPVEVLQRGAGEAVAEHALDRLAAGLGRRRSSDRDDASGAGISRSQTAVTIPSVPSEPTSRPFRS